jgi:uncharacterized membrane protein HdeD (DUF308 family)
MVLILLLGIIIGPILLIVGIFTTLIALINNDKKQIKNGLTMMLLSGIALIILGMTCSSML